MTPHSSPRRRASAASLRDERGIALAVAVFALVVIGALVAGTFFAGRLEQRGGASAMQAAQAFEAAEAGRAAAIAEWDRAATGIAVGETIAFDSLALPGMPSTWYRTTATRLTSGIYLIRSEGQQRDLAGRPLARRVLGALVKLTPPDMDIRSALTLRGHVTLGDDARIDGSDTVPAGWDALCPPAGPPVPGIRGSELAIDSDGSGCAALDCVVGAPPVADDTTVSASSFTQFGDVDFDALAAVADRTVGGTIAGLAPSIDPPVAPDTLGRCRTGDTANWGEPDAGTIYQRCTSYFPVIYAPGDLRLAGGRGQGVLLVRGDLDLAGGVDFYGSVVVLGRVTSTGSGGRIHGGLMVSNAGVESTVVAGHSVVSYSRCAVQRALIGAASARPMAERSWAQLY